MPHRLGAKSLTAICIKYVVDNMGELCKKSLWMKPTGADETDLVKVPSPFEQLRKLIAVIILERIIKKLTHNNQLNKEFLEYLITPQICKLDFSMCDQNSVASLLRLASKDCPLLSSLTLGNLGYYLSCLKLMPEFTHLQVLDVSGSASADSLLGLLGTYCVELKELYIDNSLVSDTGIRDLCVTGKCKSVLILSMLNQTNPYVTIEMQDASRVTRHGIIMALNNLPALKELRHHSIVETLAYLHRTALREGVLPDSISKYPLSTLCLRFNSPYEKRNLSEAIHLCKTLKKVKITAPGSFNDSELLDLLSAETFSDLTISGTRFKKISFHGGVAQLLRKSSIGNSLKSLVLCHIPKVNIPIITKCCPNLLSLILDKIGIYEEFRDEDSAPETFKKLESLKVVCCNSRANLLLLLSSPCLKSVVLRNCRGLNNALLKEVAELGLFQNVKHFKIISNLWITKEGIDKILNESNPLRVIRLEEVEKVTDDDVDIWRRQIQDANWDLSIEVENSDYLKWAAFDDHDEVDDVVRMY